MSLHKQTAALGIALIMCACSSEAARNRGDLREQDPFAAAERILGGNGGMASRLMERQFTPGESKFSDETGPVLPEDYTPPDFEEVDLGGMGIQEEPSFGLTPDGKVIRVPNRARRVILPPGFGPPVVIDSEGRVGVKVPAETVRGPDHDEEDPAAKK